MSGSLRGAGILASRESSISRIRRRVAELALLTIVYLISARSAASTGDLGVIDAAALVAAVVVLIAAGIDVRERTRREHLERIRNLRLRAWLLGEHRLKILSPKGY
jgi:hypothetical protein